MKKTFCLLLALALALMAPALAATSEEVQAAAAANEGNYTPGSPLTIDDFQFFSNMEDFVAYGDNMLSYLKHNDYLYMWWYPNTEAVMDIIGVDEPTTTYTWRGISIDDRGDSSHDVDPALYAKDTVLARYGAGLSGEYNARTDSLYRMTDKNGRRIFEGTASWLLYNYEDKGQLMFYFNADDEISMVACYDGIEVKADKETTKAVQAFLNENGYECGTPDGMAGKKTRAAITQYQKDHGLFPSGIVDDSMMKAMGD